MMTTAHQDGRAVDANDQLGRRGFLSKAGGAALAVPLTTSLIVSASAVPAVAKSPYGRGGNGPKHKPRGYKPKRVKHFKGGKHKVAHRVRAKIKHKVKRQVGRR